MVATGSINSAPTIVIVSHEVSTRIVTVRIVVEPVTRNQTTIRRQLMTIGREEVITWRNAGENFAAPTIRSTTRDPSTPDPLFLEITDGVGEE